MPLHGRSVTGWVVEDEVAPPPGVAVLPLKSWLGWGPPPAVVELAEWAAWRWAGPVPFFLRVGSSVPIVRALPGVVPLLGVPRRRGRVWRRRCGPCHGVGVGRLSSYSSGSTVLRIPPTSDLLELVTSVVDDPATWLGGGTSVLVLVPSVGWAARLSEALAAPGLPGHPGEWAEARAGWPIVVGSRAAAWAPGARRLAAAVVLDAHDPAYREEGAPTYSAVDVVLERARRDGAPCLLVSPVPPAVLSVGRPCGARPRRRCRSGAGGRP